MDKSEVARQSTRLVERGFVVLEGLSPAAVEDARRRVVDNAHLLKNTRPNPSSGHLAGFHRYPELEALHRVLMVRHLERELRSLRVLREMRREPHLAAGTAE